MESENTKDLEQAIAALRAEIAERDQTEKDLRQNVEDLQSKNALLKSVCDSLGEGVVVADENGRFVMYNPAAREMTGIGSTDTTPDQWAERYGVFHPDTVTPFQMQELPLYRALQGEETDQVEMYLRNPRKPKGIFLSVTGRPVKGEAGNPKGGVIVFHDITEHKQAQEELQSSYEYLDTILLNMPAGVAILEGPDFRYFRINKTLAEINGLPVEDHLGRPLAEVLPDAAPDLLPRLREVFESGEPALHHEFSIRLPKDPDQIHWLIDSFFPIKGVDGKPMAVGVVVIEITDRKRDEQDRQRLAAMLEATPDFVGIADTDGKVLYVNPAGKKMVGLGEPDDVTATTVPDYHPDWAAKQLQEELLPKAAREGDWSGELAFITRDGQEIPVSMVILSHKSSTGEIESFSTISRDITERKQAEDELRRAAEELGRSNRELDQFAFAVSHDLKAPLRSVSNFADILARNYRGQLDDKADQYLGLILDGAARMNQLIDDILAFSRVRKEEKPFEKVDCSIALDEALARLKTSIEECGTVVTRGVLPKVTGYHSQLGQLFQNLVGNAIKFHGDESPQVHVEAIKKTGEWLFSVKDNGIGIEPKFADRVFAIFQRLHTADEYPGTGIGLALCKKIVELHGGEIWVESDPGKGSTFYFTVPERDA
ncbi:MAG: PAS domain-containing protein [Planctomycetota bacterium]|jgi:PAS domain S-box-containing protein|nr:PAS domain-containing protein [Planctomycetota bacterium]